MCIKNRSQILPGAFAFPTDHDKQFSKLAHDPSGGTLSRPPRRTQAYFSQTRSKQLAHHEGEAIEFRHRLVTPRGTRKFGTPRII